ncbi:MAG: penicillin-binding transpeptidase domain-containing protein [Candidatus Korobacteraceae bacterium]
MPHTSRVRGILRAIAITVILGVVCRADAQQTPPWQAAVDKAAQTVPNTRILIVNIANGQLLATHRLAEAARTLAAPGSTLKPLALYPLIAGYRWPPDRRIACNRRLVIAGHRLYCPHPQAPPFDAREALAWSCNSYFAAVARTLPPGALGRILRSTGLLDVTGLAPSEAAAEFREPRTRDETQLALLGVAGIRVSPLELATAYRWLALQMAHDPNSMATQVVRAGLQDSASFGMANEASLGGLTVEGKTGTAEDNTSARTHGWFVGLAPAAHPQVVIAVFRPAGRGADAAHLAGQILAQAAHAEHR